MKKPFALIIIDGWGYSEETENNAIYHANTPNWQNFWQNYPHLLLDCAGSAVGLPPNQMGNSEVGHMHIGAGRTLDQPLTHINKTLTQDFLKNNALVNDIFSDHNSIHIIGLLSPGGVHSHENHIFSMAEYGKTKNIKIFIHCILDGRDTPPRSAQNSLKKLQKLIENHPNIKIATICGRYYAMDRDKHWDRTQRAYDSLMSKPEFISPDALEALQNAYDRGEDDEFVKPTSCLPKPISIQDNDIVLFMNFRSDRARQLTLALTDETFTHFKRFKFPKLQQYVTLAKYDQNFTFPVLFPPNKITNCLGEVISKQNKRQLHIAETEKYAHVTYFFNGGNEKPYKNEDRILVPSPQVKTYDHQPEMSAFKITEQLLSAMPNYDFVVCNFANPDMVGHTGDFAATVKAVETIDQCLGKIIEKIIELDGEIMITADHGNAEVMYNHKLNQPFTAHTSNPVPLLYIGENVSINVKKGTIADIAPTILSLLSYDIPKEMTGKILFSKVN